MLLSEGWSWSCPVSSSQYGLFVGWPAILLCPRRRNVLGHRAFSAKTKRKSQAGWGKLVTLFDMHVTTFLGLPFILTLRILFTFLLCYLLSFLDLIWIWVFLCLLLLFISITHSPVASWEQVHRRSIIWDLTCLYSGFHTGLLVWLRIPEAVILLYSPKLLLKSMRPFWLLCMWHVLSD